MTLLICTECGNMLREDTLATAIMYNQEVPIFIDEEGDIDFRAIPQYFIFVCHNCSFNKKVSFIDLLKFKQKTIIDIVLRMRVDRGMNSVRGVTIDEQHGVSYCGFCSGPLDGDGYCYADVISKCIIRSSFVDKI